MNEALLQQLLAKFMAQQAELYCCWQWQDQWQLVFSVGGAEALLQKSHPELSSNSEHYFRHYHLSHRLSIHESMLYCWNTGQSVQLELELTEHQGLHGHGLSMQRLELADQHYLLVETRDISAQLAQRQQQQQQEQLFSNLFAQASIAIALVDPQLSVLKSNAALRRLLDFSEQELHQQCFEQWLYPDDLHSFRLQLWHGQLGQGQQANNSLIEVRLCNREGHSIWVMLSSIQLAQDQGLCWLLIEDLSQHKQAQQELIVAREEAELAARVKSSFLASMSHEIRTPLNGVLGMLNILQRSDLPTKQLSQVEIALQSGLALLRLLNDILDFSKMEAGKLQLVNEPVDLQRLLTNIFEPTAKIAQDKGIAAKLSTHWQCTPWLLTDALRMEQILQNLLSNALKFTSQGSIELIAKLEPQDDQGLLILEVKDTGIGMNAEQLDHIFLPFTQADSSTTRRFGGTGLGLAICQQLVEQMQGGISVESKPGQGSCFTLWFSFPLTEPVATGVETLAQVETSIHNHHILIVDDSPLNLQVLSLMLETLGLSCEQANQGQQALDILQSKPDHHFDLIIMDCMMPIMDGYQASKAIRHGQAGNGVKQIPILALTANAQQGDREICLAAGMSDYLSKPVSIDALSNKLQHWLVNRTRPATEAAKAARTTQDPSSQVPSSNTLEDPNRLWQAAAFRHSLGSMAANFDSLCDLFIQQAELQLKALQLSFAEADVPALAKLAHGLKGNAKQMHCSALALLAKEMEQACKAEQWSRAQQLYPELHQCLELTLDSIKRRG